MKIKKSIRLISAKSCASTTRQVRARSDFWFAVTHFYANIFVVYLQVFEDLDEILARYITPLAEYVREVLNHKYYIEHLRAEATKEINETLDAQKGQQPGRIP